jgi:NO-binding membrane sensor protein with MHYT domain
MQQMVLYCKNLLFAQHVSGTIMPIIRSSGVLCRWLLPVVLGALVYGLLVWCVRFVGCCSILQTGHITYSSTADQQPVNQSTKYHRQQPPV